MFNKGDLVIYSSHGICQIDDICDKTYSGVTRTYYVLRPIEDHKLTINNPIDNDRAVMLEIVNKDDAEDILESFKKPGIGWIERALDRNKIYWGTIMNGNRKEIANIVNTLIRKKVKAKNEGKKFGESDRRILIHVQDILFKELALALNTTYDSINKRIMNYIKP